MKLQRNGFTLVELVTVLVLLGILAVGISSFLIFGTRIFVDSSAIDRIIGSSRYAIERMTRELRSSVPASLRLKDNGSVQCLEFVPIATSGSYIDMPFDISGSGTVFTPSISLEKGWDVFVYPLTSADVYDASNGKRFTINSVTISGDTSEINFTGTAQFSETSPAKRFYAASSPVSYCFFASGQIYRYADYGYTTSQALPPSATAVLMAENLNNDFTQQLPITIAPASLTNNAIIQLSPSFEVAGETFTYQHQVQVFNVP